MADTTVTTRKNGPYMVQGGIKIVDADGNEIAIDGDATWCSCAAAGIPQTSRSATGRTDRSGSRRRFTG